MLWRTHEILIFAVAILGFLAAIEAGFRIGRRQAARRDDGVTSHLGVLQAAVLGLLGLLFGFSLSMAVSRFEARKGLVLEEANDLGTLWLRSQFLQPADRETMARLLREYVAARIEFHDAGLNEVRLSAALNRADALQKELWTVATRVAAEQPTSLPARLFIETLNDVIDDYEKRRVALENHVPDIVVFLLFCNSVVALGFVAYGSGLNGRRRFGTTAIVAVLFSLVLTIILDIDRPRRGLVQVNQDSMLRLRESLAAVR
jgi:hypothetical protein